MNLRAEHPTCDFQSAIAEFMSDSEDAIGMKNIMMLVIVSSDTFHFIVSALSHLLTHQNGWSMFFAVRIYFKKIVVFPQIE